MISVDSYHTQKGVYTANQIPTRTERNAWHHGDVMKMKNETKLTFIKSIEKPCMNSPAVSTTEPADNPAANPLCVDSTGKTKIHEYIDIQLKHPAAMHLRRLKLKLHEI